MTMLSCSFVEGVCKQVGWAPPEAHSIHIPATPQLLYTFIEVGALYPHWKSICLLKVFAVAVVHG